MADVRRHGLSLTLDVQAFGRDYRKFLSLSAILSHLPLPAAYQIAGVAGRLKSPLRHQEAICRSAIAVSGLPVDDWHALWRRRVDDHGAFCINVFRHEAWDRGWFDSHVTMDCAELTKLQLPGKGCLFLTCHHAYQHTLCCLLGLSGFRVNALAAPEETSMIYEDVGPFIHRLHRGCAGQFNGGDYCFFETPRQAVRMTYEALTAGSVLISLNDFSLPESGEAGDEQAACHLFGRKILAPSGSIRIAQRLGTPIVAGIVIREGSDYHVVFRQLDAGLHYRDVMQAYFDFMAELLTENPGFWDGWNWFEDLPEQQQCTRGATSSQLT